MKISQRLVLIIALFVTCLITANIVAVKVISIGSFLLPAAVVVFPLSYIFGDILTEVYGYKLMRKVIWLGFLCNLVFVLFAYIGQLMPAADFWEGQNAYETILGYTPRLLAASFAGYIAGEFVNSFVLAKMKIATKGRHLWMRTIGSTIFGQGIDSALFIIIAFIGTPAFMPVLIFYHWFSKVLIEVLATPVTYRIVNYLKKKEKVDVYDEDTSFNPFSIQGN